MSRYPLNLRQPLFAAMLMASVTCASAQTTWNGGNSGSWNEEENWAGGLPVGAAAAEFSNLPSDAPVTINVGEGAVVGDLIFTNTGNRSYTFTGEQITLENSGTTLGRILTGANEVASITFENDIFFTSTTPATSGTLIIGQNGSTNHFSTVSFGNILTDAPADGVGSRILRINNQTGSTVIFNGRNEAYHISYAGETDSEVIANHISALGERAAVQKTTSSILSLRSDLTITGITNGYSWLASGSSFTSLRISETALSSTDRVLKLEKRITGVDGGFEWIDNINSTGKLILELHYSGVTVQTGSFRTNENAIVRFAQTGTTTYSSVITGEGEVQITGGGNTILTQAHGYTGNTVISSGTLTLNSSGGLHFLIGDSGVNNQITGSASGFVSLDGTFTFDLSGASANMGDSWTIVDLASLGGVVFGDDFAVNGFLKTDNLWVSGDYQFDQATGQLSVIPEPTSLVLLGVSGAALLCLRRRRSRV